MRRILDGLIAAIAELGAEAVLMPQTGATSACRVELYLAGLSPGGQAGPAGGGCGYETLRLTALVKSDGTHETWLTDTVRFARRFARLEEEPLAVHVPDTVVAGKVWVLNASWKRLSEGRFEYPNDEEGTSMPVTYVETWRVELSYPAALIAEEEI
jgi:hypothetical protein